MIELQGARVLVVEDELLISMLMDQLLTEQGCSIVGPAETVESALALAEHSAIDCALLDLHLAGREVYPVADMLARRAIPFTFVSGATAGDIEEDHRARPVLLKPFDELQLTEAVRQSLGRTPDIENYN